MSRRSSLPRRARSQLGRLGLSTLALELSQDVGAGVQSRPVPTSLPLRGPAEAPTEPGTTYRAPVLRCAHCGTELGSLWAEHICPAPSPSPARTVSWRHNDRYGIAWHLWVDRVPCCRKVGSGSRPVGYRDATPRDLTVHGVPFGRVCAQCLRVWHRRVADMRIAELQRARRAFGRAR